MKTTFVHKKLLEVAAVASAFALISLPCFNSVGSADESDGFTVTFKPTMVGHNLAIDLINLNFTQKRCLIVV